MAGSRRCTAEIEGTLQINYTLIKMKKIILIAGIKRLQWEHKGQWKNLMMAEARVLLCEGVGEGPA